VMWVIDLSMCLKGGAPLLRGGAFLEWAAHLLRGGALSLSFELTLVNHLGCGTLGYYFPHLAIIYSHLVRPLMYTWCALPHGHLHHFSYLSKHPPIARVSKSWDKDCFHIVICTIIFCIGIRKALEATWCGSHVWMLIVMYQSMR
jgi:hypothetical protein